MADPTATGGCAMIRNGDGSAVAQYNAKSTVPCAQSTTKIGSSTSPISKVTVGLSLAESTDETMHRGPKGQFCTDNKDNVLKEFPAKTATSPADAAAALAACEAFCEGNGQCMACSVDAAGPTGLQWAAIPLCGPLSSWTGSIPGDISSKTSDGKATITLSGPSDVWFAIGFGATEMHDQPYTLVVNDAGVTERKLGTCGTEADHCPGTVLNTSVALVSNTVVNNVRTVVVTRPFSGPTKDYFCFNPATISTVNYISARGTSQTFGYHGTQNHDSLTMSLSVPVGPTCVCDMGESGKLCNTNSTGCNSFTKGCTGHSPTLGNHGEASGSLLVDRNPTCNSGSYVGGLSCCSHKRIMLDDDQIVPDELLRYHMKFRFWYQEYKPEVKNVSNASHVDLERIYFQTEANAGEYDIPPAFYTPGQPKISGYPEVGPYPELSPGSSCTGNCPSGDDCECTHTITYNHSVSNIRLIYAGGHCHAPACVGIWLYRNDPGHKMELVCHQAPLYGTR